MRVAKENVEINKTENVTVAVSDLLACTDRIDGGYDICCANIVADVIIRMAPSICDFIADDGVLIVSGIITERADETVSALSENGWKLVDERRENGWFAGVLKKA